MSTNADNFRQRVVDHAFEAGSDAITFATRLGARRISDEPAHAWDGEGQGFLWRFRDGSCALIREDGHEVATGGRAVAARIQRQYGAVLATDPSLDG
jgi:hypothetical protein